MFKFGGKAARFQDGHVGTKIAIMLKLIMNPL